MRSMNDLLRIACDFLNEHESQYVLVGGITVIAYGVPRTTMDADFIIQMEPEDLKTFAEFLGEHGFFSDPEDIDDAIRTRSHFSAEDRDSLLRLDIRGVYSEMDQRTLKNRRSMDLDGMKIYLARPEDVIFGKLLYGSDQDIKDAESIYVRQLPSLNIKYLEEICDAGDLRPKLDEMRDKAKKYLTP